MIFNNRPHLLKRGEKAGDRTLGDLEVVQVTDTSGMDPLLDKYLVKILSDGSVIRSTALDLILEDYMLKKESGEKFEHKHTINIELDDDTIDEGRASSCICPEGEGVFQDIVLGG